MDKVEKNSLYHEVVQRYLTIEKRLANLRRERDCLDKQIEIYEEESYAINDILCKHGKHVYEHFIEGEEEGQKKIEEAIDFAIKATDTQDEYGRGMRNGMRYVKSLFDGKEPEYEHSTKED